TSLWESRSPPSFRIPTSIWNVGIFFCFFFTVCVRDRAACLSSPGNRTEASSEGPAPKGNALVKMMIFR
ncbi:hypothetical protein, partial [Galbibacter mesophilus]|uniref:hypothetical protein n=1 Tax=Galbibacter mesophilus TaxID=379069 RepID=UPI001A937D51